MNEVELLRLRLVEQEAKTVKLEHRVEQLEQTIVDFSTYQQFVGRFLRWATGKDPREFEILHDFNPSADPWLEPGERERYRVIGSPPAPAADDSDEQPGNVVRFEGYKFELRDRNYLR
jgi:hypothetical protein